LARRLIMWNTSNLDMAFSPSRSPLPTLRNNGPILSRAMPAAMIQGCRVVFQLGMAWHFVAFAAFLVQPQLEPLAMLKEVAALHRHHRANPREAINHHSDQRPVAQPY
jgi:hypothetical protein